jgi:hypothetical protein
MTNSDASADPALVLVDAERLIRKAGGLSVLLLGVVCAVSAASGLMLRGGTHLSPIFLIVFVIVYLDAPIYIRRWRAKHGQPDIRRTVAISSEGPWWRWKSARGSIWAIHPLAGILILAIAGLTKLLLVKCLDGPHGTERGEDALAVAISLNYLLIFRSLRMTEDLLMGLGLGLIGIMVMILPSASMETTLRWAWTGIGLLMIVTGAGRHLRWRRWVAEHGPETP